MTTKTKIRISFASKTQGPALMIVKEYYNDNTISFAEVVYQEENLESDIVFSEEIFTVKEFRIERPL